VLGRCSYGDRRTTAQGGNLTKSHTHLGDDDLRVLLQPKERQRQADLVVQAALRPDRRRVWSTERAEDVLRRGLAGRSDDGDDLRLALRPDERGQLRKRNFLILRDECRRASVTRLVHVPDTRVQGDEEIARADIARVSLDTGDEGVRPAAVEASELEVDQLLPANRDHGSAPSARARAATMAR
jgi:hypothetical protein